MGVMGLTVSWAEKWLSLTNKGIYENIVLFIQTSLVMFSPFPYFTKFRMFPILALSLPPLVLNVPNFSFITTSDELNLLWPNNFVNKIQLSFIMLWSNINLYSAQLDKHTNCIYKTYIRLWNLQNTASSPHSQAQPGLLIIQSGAVLTLFNTLRPRQNGLHFADAIFKCIFLNENVWIPLKSVRFN